jgi:alkylation response protein AidB-like acyl-CoA dehydrogenase
VKERKQFGRPIGSFQALKHRIADLATELEVSRLLVYDVAQKVDDDPTRLLTKLREANRGGDVHLVGGPRTIETFRSLGALDRLGLLVLPLVVGDGMRLSPPLSPDARLSLETEHVLPEGAVELVYACV